MLKVVALTLTCPSFPSQWEGRDDRGRIVYVRYRSGMLRIGVGETLDAAVGVALTGDLFEKRCGDKFDGQMSYDELKSHAPDIDWP